MVAICVDGNAGEGRSHPDYRNFNVSPEKRNNIDLLMALGYDFPAAVEVLEQWLRNHRQQHATSNT